MTSWLVSVPAWGERCVRVFEAAAAPALLMAAARSPDPVRFVVHTDSEARVRAAFRGYEVEVRSVGSSPTYTALQEAHADAISSAGVGECVALLNADLVVSGNFFERCLEHFTRGQQAVVLLGIRTAAGSEPPPPGAEPAALLAWAWEHRHQIIRDLEWPNGSSLLPTNLFFSAGDTVVARGFHLHPAAIVKHGGIQFRSTIDGDLLDCFPCDAVHVVTSPSDCAMCEISPPERRFPVRIGGLTAEAVARSMRSRASEMHRWLVTHRIGVVGPTQDCGDGEVVERILDLLSRPAPPERSAQFSSRRELLAARGKGVVPAGRRGNPR